MHIGAAICAASTMYASISDPADADNRFVSPDCTRQHNPRPLGSHLLRNNCAIDSCASSATLQALPGAGVALTHQCHSAAEAAPGASAGGSGRSWLGLGAVGLGAAVLGAGTHVALAEEEAEHGLHAPQHPWSHEGMFSSYDHSAIRRGYQVYQQVTICFQGREKG